MTVVAITEQFNDYRPFDDLAGFVKKLQTAAASAGYLTHGYATHSKGEGIFSVEYHYRNTLGSGSKTASAVFYPTDRTTKGEYFIHCYNAGGSTSKSYAKNLYEHMNKVGIDCRYTTFNHIDGVAVRPEVVASFKK